MLLLVLAFGNHADAQYTSRQDTKEQRMNTTTLASNKELVRKLYEDIINERRLDLLDGIIAPEYTNGEKDETGPQAYRSTVTDLVRSFPDIKFTVEDIIAEDDLVVARWNWKATHTAAFRGIPACHKVVTNTALVMYRVKDGKITASWLQADRLSVLQQIGAVLQKPAQ